MLKGHPNLRKDHWEHDYEFEPLHVACLRRGVNLHAVVWDDPSFMIEEFDACVIGTTWDYTDKAEVFLSTLGRFASRRPLFNPLSVVRWNLNKTYLHHLADKGVPTVPTLWRERADVETIGRAFHELGVDEIVIKPVVGASAWRQVRLKLGENLPPGEELPPAATMIQPFLEAVTTEGEFSFLFFDRQFSHCARKIPLAGDYRVQTMYGGREEIYHPTQAELALAGRVLDAVDGRLLYARVDMLRQANGELALMELELVEPYLYPEQGPNVGESFAVALERMLDP